MGAALTRGVQEHVLACVKHFACNSMENARFTVDVTADERALHEVYLPHFRRVVREGVATPSWSSSAAGETKAVELSLSGPNQFQVQIQFVDIQPAEAS